MPPSFLTNVPCHNPYFTGNLFATGEFTNYFGHKDVTILILLETSLQHVNHSYNEKTFESQSLFYWKPLCNDELKKDNERMDKVTILILLETSLQQVN